MRYNKKVLNHLIKEGSSLFERIELNFAQGEISASEKTVDSRLNKWCRISADGDWELFKRRLSINKLDLEVVRPLLGDISISSKSKLPRWAATIDEILKSIEFDSSNEIKSVAEGKYTSVLGALGASKLQFNQMEQIPFNEVFYPFIYYAHTKLNTDKQIWSSFIMDDVVFKLENKLLERLSFIASSTLEFEFSVFRSNRHSSLGRFFNKISNISSNIIYTDFIKSMLNGEFISFLMEYPVLAKLMSTTVDFWVESSKDLLSRLVADTQQISEIFCGGNKPGRLSDICANLSDFHNNGCSVALLTFENGLKLIYKPKDCDLEKTFNEFLSWINTKRNISDFKTHKVINNSTHAWVEYIEHLPCKSKEGLRSYYYRAGMLLAVVYCLEGSDCHYQNIIASGEHPVLIDVETLFHQRRNGEEVHEARNGAIADNNTEVYNSVLRTGLLPGHFYFRDGEAFDASGISTQFNKNKSIRFLKWVDANTDNMRREYVAEVQDLTSNVPYTIDDKPYSEKHIESIIQGFEEIYRFFITNRQELLSETSLLHAFKGKKGRFVLRSTRIYTSLVEKSLEPSSLKSGVERFIEMDILSKDILPLSHKSFQNGLMLIEHNSLDVLDIPYYSILIDSNSIIAGDYIFENYFEQSSFENVIKRLKGFEEKDLRNQITFIKQSFIRHIP